MLNATEELFTSEYFLTKAILGKYLEDSEKVFAALGKIFLISEGKAEELFRLCENETARAITTEKEFMQYSRMQKYSRLIGAEIQADGLDEAANVKGNAIMLAKANNLVPPQDASGNVVYNCLCAAAAGGSVVALRLTGILQCEGIFLGKNRELGIKTLSKAADWNDVVATLALLRYCKDTRPFNMARLRQEVENTPFAELYKTACKKYGEALLSDIEEVRLLEKSFNSRVLKRETYDPKYARILNSRALYARDKERAVFSLNKEQLSAISELPLKLSHDKTAAADAEISTAIVRGAETAAISRALKNSDLRGLSSFRPLCLCSDSKYVLNMYARAIGAKSKGTHVEIIDVAALGEYDFDPTPNNIFVRSIDEDKDNRFLLFFYGDISERKAEAAKALLQSSRRAKFHLNSPNVTLNLSAVLPVCFCDERNAKWLSPYCDEIRVGEICADEMDSAVSDILAHKRKIYGVNLLEFAGDRCELLREYGMDKTERLIDAAVRARREKGANITLTREILEEYADGDDRQIIGFGGGTYGD